MTTYAAYPDQDGHISSPSSYTTTSAEFVAGYSSGTQRDAFFRWASVTIPSGSTINSSVMSVVAYNNSGTCDIRVACEAADSPALPTDYTDAKSRTVTSAYAHINTAPANAPYDTPDFAASVQEVIDRGGWNSGQAMVVHWRDFKGTGTGRFSGRSLERTGTSEDPFITIDYTEAAAGSGNLLLLGVG